MYMEQIYAIYRKDKMARSCSTQISETPVGNFTERQSMEQNGQYEACKN